MDSSQRATSPDVNHIKAPPQLSFKVKNICHFWEQEWNLAWTLQDLQGTEINKRKKEQTHLDSLTMSVNTSCSVQGLLSRGAIVFFCLCPDLYFMHQQFLQLNVFIPIPFSIHRKKPWGKVRSHWSELFRGGGGWRGWGLLLVLFYNKAVKIFLKVFIEMMWPPPHPSVVSWHQQVNCNSGYKEKWLILTAICFLCLKA